MNKEYISFSIIPTINGTDIKNEKRADSSLSIPNKTEIAIVVPDLEIPGKIAIAWAHPIIREEIKVIFLFVGFDLSAKSNSEAVISSINPTRVNI
mgnify:CR=1 FL=1